ncbi:MAG: hypothetical protein AB7J28_15905 [Hyphomonadaceae bacterium]
MISITDKEIQRARGRRVAFTDKLGARRTGVIVDFWGAGHYWVDVDGEPKIWSVDHINLCYVGNSPELEAARAEYIALSAADVRAHPQAFKARVVADPEGAAASVIDGLSLGEVRRLIREQKAEMRAAARSK